MILRLSNKNEHLEIFPLVIGIWKPNPFHICCDAVGRSRHDGVAFVVICSYIKVLGRSDFDVEKVETASSVN